MRWPILPPPYSVSELIGSSTSSSLKPVLYGVAEYFTSSKTKAELLAAARARRLLIAPVLELDWDTRSKSRFSATDSTGREIGRALYAKCKSLKHVGFSEFEFSAELCLRDGRAGGVVLAALLVWTASAQDAKAVIGNASKAMGVEALTSVQYSATGFDFALGQAPNSGAPWPRAIAASRGSSLRAPGTSTRRPRRSRSWPPWSDRAATATSRAGCWTPPRG